MIATIISWVGAGMVLIGFALNVTKKVTPETKIYIILNFLGALLLGVSAFMAKSYAFVALYSVWTVFSLSSLIKGGTK